VRLGTSSWKFDDWKGVFFPRSGDELAYYARFFNTVEIDSTWYATPSRRVVKAGENVCQTIFVLRPKCRAP
jgi:uncharacterized protein YecE (DUF72 family)